MRYLILIVLALVGATWLDASAWMNDASIAGRMYWVNICFCLAAVIYAVESLCGRKEKVISIQIISSIVLGNAFAQAMYGIAQFFYLIPSSGSFRMMGSFDNPAGLSICLSLSLPFALNLIHGKKWQQIIAWAASLPIVLAIVLCGMRSGILALVAIMALSLFHFLPKRRKAILRVAVVSLLILLPSLYILKKDSADGRLLIWRCGVDMVLDKPLFGHGTGAFRAHYMDYQADFFKQHPNSHFAVLADNVQQPFNEYLGLAIHHGLAGLFLLFVMMFILWKAYKDSLRREESFSALLSLVALALIALFSYPGMYAFSRVMMLVCCIILIGNASWTWKGELAKRKNGDVLVALVLLPCSLGAGLKLSQDIAAEVKWKKATQTAYTSQTQHWMNLYQDLEKQLSQHPFFLYNYSAQLYLSGRYEDCIVKAMDCRRYWADYDVEMLIAQAYEKLQQDDLAEAYFIHASNMCPNRFFPLYYLMNLYQRKGDSARTRDMADKIITKPVKVPSSEVSRMRQEAKKILQSNKNDHYPR
ncbi:MAG: O-antigen ligase family protein [Bacteroidales bacterium]|nr:O-antigen ligase family protein [Bacteroidales bacterium]